MGAGLDLPPMHAVVAQGLAPSAHGSVCNGRKRHGCTCPRARLMEAANRSARLAEEALLVALTVSSASVTEDCLARHRHGVCSR